MANPAPEVRTILLPPGELKADRDGDRPAIVGHAVVFDRWTTLYEGKYLVLREIVRKGAFATAIRHRQDVRALFNHDSNYLLGRVSAGTLELAEDRTGLSDRIFYPDTQLVRDLVITPIERGDITGQSFAFLPSNGPQEKVVSEGKTLVIDRGGERITVRMDGDRQIEERELLDVELFDVGPVAFPAYEQTDLALRSLAEQREQTIQGRRSHRHRLHLAEVRLRLHDAAILSTR